MRLQEVRVEYPALKLTVGGEVWFEWPPMIITTHSIKTLRKRIEAYTRGHIQKASSALREALEGEEDEDEYGVIKSFTLPEISLTEGETVLLYSSPFSMKATNVDLSIWHLYSNAIKGKPSAVADSCATAISDQGVKIIFKEDNIALHCNVVMDRWSWRWTALLTDTMFKYETGKEVRIKYGNFLHNALWRVYKKTDIQEIDKKTLATLTWLGLTMFPNTILSQGEKVLIELDQIDPSNYPSLVSQFGGALLGTRPADTPVCDFAEKEGFVDISRSGVVTPTDRGKQWLIDHCKELLKGNCTEKRMLELVPYMPMEHLSEFLASSKEKVREAAKKRADELEGRE